MIFIVQKKAHLFGMKKNKINKSIKLRYRLHVHIIDAHTHTHTFHTINTFRLNAFHSVRIPEGTNDFLYLSFLHFK